MPDLYLPEFSLFSRHHTTSWLPEMKRRTWQTRHSHARLWGNVMRGNMGMQQQYRAVFMLSFVLALSSSIQHIRFFV
ncbi:hypothetical protein K402DRAFT_24173 [Aulographum hederae CBS 113979]|uniref:Uncharacterized protein n=1 Tax=Aulographum hederae CBS 113979 TaxID=1176131 RepID=A0A6G1H5Z4_9PEZI|nr:hypothetical protein K402DRAFT_24173 [Aulographum hederae CBS 113979]